MDDFAWADSVWARTSKIVVIASKEDPGNNLVIAVKVNGVGNGCVNETSENICVQKIEIIDYDHYYRRLNRFETRAVIDNLFIQINNNPGSEGLVIFKFDETESRKEKLARIKIMLDAIRYRKYDPSRLALAISKKASTLEYTPLVVPTGKEFPINKEEYNLFKGEDLIKNLKKTFPKGDGK